VVGFCERERSLTGQSAERGERERERTGRRTATRSAPTSDGRRSSDHAISGTGYKIDAECDVRDASARPGAGRAIAGGGRRESRDSGERTGHSESARTADAGLQHRELLRGAAAGQRGQTTELSPMLRASEHREGQAQGSSPGPGGWAWGVGPLRLPVASPLRAPWLGPAAAAGGARGGGA
jgi:hypothetical protein